MAKDEAAGRSGSGAFVVAERQADEIGRQNDQSPTETNVGGFVVTDRQEPSSRTSTRLGSDDAATVRVEQPLPSGGRRCSVCGELGHTARTCQAEGTSGIATRASRKPAKDAVASIAPMLVGTANFCVVTTFGADCGLTDLEGRLLIPSLQRTLERMPAGAVTKAAVVIDPLVILTVMVMWARRIGTIKDTEAKEKYQIKPTEAARAAGVTGYTHSVPPVQQQTAPQTESPVNINAVRDRTVTANGATSYGAPDDIRRSFGSDAEFAI